MQLRSLIRPWPRSGGVGSWVIATGAPEYTLLCSSEGLSSGREQRQERRRAEGRRGENRREQEREEEKRGDEERVKGEEMKEERKEET